MFQNASKRNLIDTQAAINPREQGPNNWKWRPQTLGSGYMATFFPAEKQTLNWTQYVEPSNYNGLNQRESLTGKEPAFYGEHFYPRDPLNENQTNQRAMNMIANSQLQRWDGKNQIYAKVTKVPHNPYTLSRDYVGNTRYKLSQMTR